MFWKLATTEFTMRLAFVVVAPDNVQCDPTCKLVVKIQRQAKSAPYGHYTTYVKNKQLGGFA